MLLLPREQVFLLHLQLLTAAASSAIVLSIFPSDQGLLVFQVATHLLPLLLLLVLLEGDLTRLFEVLDHSQSFALLLASQVG